MTRKRRGLKSTPPILLKVLNSEEAAALANALGAAKQESFGRGRSAIDRWTQQIRRLLPAAIEVPPNVFTLDGHAHVTGSEATTIQNIFCHWRDVMAKPRARLDDKRRNLIRRRLRESFSEVDLRAAIDGCRASPWHQGENESGTRYVELSLIFRSAEHIERFGEFATSPPKPRPSVGKTEAARAAWVKVMDHVRGGRYRHGGIDEGPIDRAVQSIGGYYAIGQSRSTDLRFIERHFIESFRSSGVDQVPVRRRQQ